MGGRGLCKRDTQFLGPKVVSEFYPGWLGYWGETLQQLRGSFPSATGFVDNLNYVHSINGSVSIYMIHGGTNFGFTAGTEPGNPGPGVYFFVKTEIFSGIDIV